MEKILLWPNDPSRTTLAMGQSMLLPFLHGGDEVRPAILVIPGGGYSNVCHGYEGSEIAEEFVKRGFHAFVLDYRCGDFGKYPAPQQDAARAVKILRSRAREFHLDPARIVSCGFSAGAHLAGCLATSIIDKVDASAGDDADAFSPRVNGAILCYAVVKLVYKNGHVASGRNLLGDDLDKIAADFDLTTHLDDKTPPVFLFHTAADQVVPVQGALEMAGALIEKGIPTSLHIYPFGPHGAGLAKDTIDTILWPQEAAAFLRRAWDTQAKGQS